MPSVFEHRVFLARVSAVIASFALANSCFLSSAGLETFISTAKKLPCSDLYDVVEGYIKISMECAEIFKLLETEKHIESEVSSIFSGDGTDWVFGQIKL